MARRKKKDDGIVVLMAIASALPWWASVVTAIGAFLICHAFATTDIPTAKNMAEFAPAMQKTILRSIATVLQYVLPIIFLGGAIASAFAQFMRGGETRGKVDPPYDASPPRENLGGPPGVIPTSWAEKPAVHVPPWASYDSEMVPPIATNVTRWTPELLNALEWKRFEMVCAGLFERLGFVAKTGTKGADGGIDIHLFRPSDDQAVAIVQCKAWTGSSKVGVRYIRELHGVMASKQITDGIFATTTVFSDEAKEYAKANHIDLMDGSALLRSILTLTEEQQASLLQLATVGDYTTPTCPSCAAKMTMRNPSSGRPFWGCVHFPRCRSIINIAKT